MNFCTYYSKGVADYVGIWDLDEFFIPKGTNKNLLNVISNAYPEKTLDHDIPRRFNENTSLDKKWPGGRGWADGSGHPFCFLQLRYVRLIRSTKSLYFTICNSFSLIFTLLSHSFTYPPPNSYFNTYAQIHIHVHTLARLLSSEVLAYRQKPEATDTAYWVGERFVKPTEPTTSKNHGHFAFKKSIIPTANIFQIGLHVHGGCHLEYPWNGCEKNHTGFCYKSSVKINNSNNGNVVVDEKFSTTHSFIDQVRSSEVKSIDSQSQGVLYHIMLFRDLIPSNVTDPTATNDYTMKYFPKTLSALKKRGYEALINTPRTVKKIPTVADSWVEYDLVYNSRKTFGTLFPGFGKISPTVPSSVIKNALNLNEK